jgi:hypothetical protein
MDSSTLPEIKSKVEPSFDIFDPSNIHTYTDLWTKCHKFLRSLSELSQTGLSVTVSKDNVDKFSIVCPQGIVKEDLTKKQVACFMLLARYRNLIVILMKKNESTHDFFNELESYREYHARQLVALCSNEDDLDIEVTRFSINSLDDLDKTIYYINRNSTLDSYDKTWVINALMISMARWEIQEFKTDLYKEDYLSGIVGEDISQLPSHLRILSRVIEKDKDKVLEMYPKSVLMNYSHFYPSHLYHTGTEPLNVRNIVKNRTTEE